jgi:hypothetical protein
MEAVRGHDIRRGGAALAVWGRLAGPALRGADAERRALQEPGGHGQGTVSDARREIDRGEDA